MRAGNGSDREIRANIAGEWYCIEPGKSIDVTDPNVLTVLGEYGAEISARELEEALEGAAQAARAQNSKTASANASTADIEARHAQVTTDVATGAVIDPNAGVVADRTADPVPGTGDTPPVTEQPPAEELKGEALDKALEDRGLPKTGTAPEKRDRVAEYDKAQAELAQQAGGSTPQA